MSESKPYFYETEIEWKGDKGLEACQRQAAGDRSWCAARVQRPRRKLVAGTSFRRLAE